MSGSHHKNTKTTRIATLLLNMKMRPLMTYKMQTINEFIKLLEDKITDLQRGLTVHFRNSEDVFTFTIKDGYMEIIQKTNDSTAKELRLPLHIFIDVCNWYNKKITLDDLAITKRSLWQFK